MPLMDSDHADQFANRSTSAPVTCVSLESEARLAITGHEDGSVSIWDIDSAESETTVMLHNARVTAASFAAHGRQFATIADDRTLRLSDVTGQSSRVVARSPGNVMRFVAVCRTLDAHVAISRSFDAHVLRVIDVNGRIPPVGIRDSTRRFSTAAFLTDHTLVTLTDGCDLEVWVTDEGTPRLCISSGLSAPLHMAVASAGDRVALGDQCGRIAAWDLGGGGCTFVADAHTAPVRTVAFDESGSYLASADSDGVLRIASAETGEAIAVWNAQGAIACCAVTSRLASSDIGYRRHAHSRAPVVVVAGTDDGEVQFIDCRGLTSRWENEE